MQKSSAEPGRVVQIGRGGSCARGTGTTRSLTAVSYTHLDVYKRQALARETETPEGSVFLVRLD